METMLTIRKMGMVYSLGSQVMSTRETMLKMTATVMERCHGLMVHFIKDNGKRVFNMDMER